MDEFFLVGSAEDELEMAAEGTGLMGSAVAAIPAKYLLEHAADDVAAFQ